MNRFLTNRKGNMLVLVALLMIVFMVGAAFCVDIAYMHMVKAELRTAVDAASRAGTEELARTQDQDVAINAALDIASQNSVAGQGLSLAANEIVVGEATLQDNGKFQFSAGGTQLNSVSVVGRRDDGSIDGTVGLFFGGLFGVDAFRPVADSVSASSVRDIALVLDRSGSMNIRSGNGTRRTALISAVNIFLTEIEATSPNSVVSLTTYATTSSRDTPLTDNFGLIRSQVNRIPARGRTNIFQGLRQGSDSLEQDAQRRRFADKTVVLLTDGNFNEGGTPIPSALVAASREQTIHTITFSNGANQTVMRQVADIGDGIHIHADDAADLAEAFREIARTLAVILIE